MLVYHSAFDMYHSVYRMIQLLTNLKKDYVELERLRIWDYYLAFPNEMTKIKFEREGVSVFEKKNWQKMIDFMIDVVPKFEKAFKKHIRELSRK